MLEVLNDTRKQVKEMKQQIQSTNSEYQLASQKVTDVQGQLTAAAARLAVVKAGTLPPSSVSQVNSVAADCDDIDADPLLQPGVL